MRNLEINAAAPGSEHSEPRTPEQSRPSLGTQIRKLAKSLSDAGGRLGDALRPGRKKEQSTTYERFSGRTHQGAARHASKSKGPEHQFFKGNRLCITEQTRMANEIQHQVAHLAAPNSEAFFNINTDYLVHDMLERKVNSAQLAALTHRNPLLKSLQSASFVEPQHSAQLVLADLYKKKYDIQLFVQQTAVEDPAKLAGLLLDKLKGNHGQPVGLVLKWPAAESSFGRVPVSPILIQHTAKGIDVVNLDNTSAVNVPLLNALKCFHESGIQVRQLKVQTPDSRALPHTLDTEAMQLLKDALVEHQRIGGNLGERYWEEYANDSSEGLEHVACTPFFIDMPPHLGKTAQTEKALKNSRVQLDEVLHTFAPSANPFKQQTVGQHRQRFSVKVESNELANHFLTVKSYKNAYRVLEQLKSLPDSTARQKYIDTLQTRHGM